MTARHTSARPLPLLLLAIVLLWPAVPAGAQTLGGTVDQRSRQQVATLFGTARAALAAGDGVTLLAQLSRGSLARLEAIRNAARLGGAAPLGGFTPSEKLGILGLRRHFTPAELRRLRTSELIGRGLNTRWLKAETVRAADLGPVAIAGNRASAPVLIEGKPSLAHAEFVREGGQWRFDLSRTTSTADTLLRVLIQLSGQSEESYLGRLLEHVRR